MPVILHWIITSLPCSHCSLPLQLPTSFSHVPLFCLLWTLVKESPLFFLKKKTWAWSVYRPVCCYQLSFFVQYSLGLLYSLSSCAQTWFLYRSPPLILAVESCPCVSVCVHLFVYCVSLFMLKWLSWIYLETLTGSVFIVMSFCITGEAYSTKIDK